jgi:uncharacterized protein (DUF362 family)
MRSLGAAASGLLLAACQTENSAALPSQTAPALTPTNQPAPIDATSTASVPYLPEAQVIIGRRNDYEPKSLYEQLGQMFDNLWEFKEVSPNGARIAVLINPCGLGKGENLPGQPPANTTATHPEIVRALGRLLLDLGAGQLSIVAAVSAQADFSTLGYAAVADELGAQLFNLNEAAPYPDFGRLSSGPAALMYPEFQVNRILTEIDSFVSVAKMKTHALAGLSLAIENLSRIVPLELYREQKGDTERSAFLVDAATRFPRILVDLNRACPVSLAVIDGIHTIDGGESGRVARVKPVAPGLLVAGKNALAVDTIAATLMGFDASARRPAVPFTYIDNYLNIAHNLELGTNLLEKIDLLGPAIEEARFPFSPPGEYTG